MCLYSFPISKIYMFIYIYDITYLHPFSSTNCDQIQIYNMYNLALTKYTREYTGADTTHLCGIQVSRSISFFFSRILYTIYLIYFRQFDDIFLLVPNYRQFASTLIYYLFTRISIFIIIL
ncbi:hypothetical protein GUJ93_ZPchr0005g14264 [Zizania palustris]|uniref:Uncharacterized protein n=1 Tax=Zizania palustris TaxID=103762 RepID=A0A8J5SW53_ZIZPA|nr:hypothetical protein GUJ93_ZPchr0005g14264 [Zizania palustris]